ncbi:MAG: FAD-dependent oxidoreductase [Acidobacteria bacterium]|nr:FAD-dependent oxidoreductase [Acidobacteriota bacterium]
MESTPTCLIIGAGMAGLSAARSLTAAGHDVTIIDKGRGVGGRMATRWSDTPEGVRAWYDHGAQFFTVRSDKFQAEVDRWRAAGLVLEWAHGFADGTGLPRADGHPRYAVRGGMNALARELAAPLGIRLQTRADAIAWSAGWQIRLESGETLTASHLILTPPVEQSLALLDAGGTRLPDDARAALDQIDYDPCFALLVELEEPSRLPAPGAVQIQGEPIAWIGDNHRKGISPAAFTVTIHAGPEFTRTHWDSPHEVVATKLLAAADRWLGSPVRRWQAHRWRYSQPRTPHAEACLLVESPAPLVFAGDAFGQPRLEGAFLSGLAAANALQLP